jgi:preprotein translocase subunit SecA
MKKFFTSIELRNAYKELKLINNLSEEMKNLSNEKLKAKTKEFKERLKNDETLDDIRVEVFAVIREVIDRRLKKRPFDVQILGGLVLDYGSVSEMKTGEGKTIASIAPVYLNALTGKGVIVSTVNEYLAVRDATEVSQVHE